MGDVSQTPHAEGLTAEIQDRRKRKRDTGVKDYKAEQSAGQRGSRKKGSDHVISMLHDFLENRCGEDKKNCDVLHVTADNCAGQNKNRHVVGYLLWRIITGRHKRITFSFMEVGHTKNECDGAFGSVKRTLYKTPLTASVQELRQVVRSAHLSSQNMEAVAGDDVMWFDWQSFLEQFFVALPGISTQHILHMSCEYPWAAIAAARSEQSVHTPNAVRVLASRRGGNKVTLEAVCMPAQHGFKPLSAFQLGTLPLNSDRFDYLAYKIGPYLEALDPSNEGGVQRRTEQFYNELGAHPQCPKHAGRRSLSEPQKRLRRRLLRDERPDSVETGRLEQHLNDMPKKSKTIPTMKTDKRTGIKSNVGNPIPTPMLVRDLVGVPYRDAGAVDDEEVDEDDDEDGV